MFVGQMRKQNAASRLCGRAGAAWLVAAATAAVAGCNERSARPDPDPPTPPVMHQVSVSVSGPGGYNQNVAGTVTLTDLEPGNYVINALPVSVGGAELCTVAGPKRC